MAAVTVPAANGQPDGPGLGLDDGGPDRAARADTVDALSYEQARDELVEVVRQLESGAASLEESLQLWERGEALAAKCQAWLEGARRRLDAVRSEPTDHPGNEV